jgi:hypothetical protein
VHTTKELGMRNGILWLAAALLAGVILEGEGMGQPPGRRGGPRGGLERALDDLKIAEKDRETARTAVRAYRENVQRLTDLASAELILKLKEVVSQEEHASLRKATANARRVGPGRPPGQSLEVNDMVERIMSFDKNKDGKVTRDELPERMHNLIARGDTNKDGALDREEVKKLAADLAREDGPRRRGPGAPPGSLTPGAVERAVGALKLEGKKKEAAETAIKACKESIRKLIGLARADLLLKMEDVLRAVDLEKLKAALERDPGIPGRPFGRGGPPFRRGGPPGRDRP